MLIVFSAKTAGKSFVSAVRQPRSAGLLTKMVTS
jgi:hypothetical protein